MLASERGLMGTALALLEAGADTGVRNRVSWAGKPVSCSKYSYHGFQTIMSFFLCRRGKRQQTLRSFR